jgi:general secretion pathway protein H
MRLINSSVVSRPSAGFTLLEMLAVLAILALVAALTIPTLRRPPDNLRLEAATRTLASVLRLSRAQAITRNADVIVTIHADRKIFKSSTGSSIELDQEFSVETIFAAPLRRGRAAGAIRFFRDGTSSGGDIVLTLNKRRTHISVDWLTGQARLDLAGNGGS